MVWQAPSAAAKLTVAMYRYMFFSLWLAACDWFPGRLRPLRLLLDRGAVASGVLDDFVEHLHRCVVLAQAHEQAPVAIARLQPDELRDEHAVGGERGVVLAAAFEQARLQQPHLRGPRLRRLALQPGDRTRRLGPVLRFDCRPGKTVEQVGVVRVRAVEAALVEPDCLRVHLVLHALLGERDFVVQAAADLELLGARWR